MKTLLLALGVVATPLAALAGGPVTTAPEPYVQAPAPIVARPDGDWGGFYAGAQLGWGNVYSDGAGLGGNGAIGGVFGGYRYDFGRAVVGAEIDYSAANIDLAAGDNSLDSVARLKLQAGYDLGRALVYVTAGGARAETTLGGDSVSDSGWFAGLGMDYNLSDTWSVGGEVLTHRFDDFDNSGIDVKATTVQARVAYRF